MAYLPLALWLLHPRPLFRLSSPITEAPALKQNFIIEVADPPQFKQLSLLFTFLDALQLVVPGAAIRVPTI